ncbi:4-hydroxy-tetrahydrodipicolinate synthase [Thermovibrio ammonificans]|uniref:4-hydroxy-tetrahydrodipicolinate synthase n=1 Tax=Thermovibrio ammonificans (strain DSM 15698 / JCM 12110 / HB-1) TaxID=648996 RepID=E8T3M4_THEA1|nr:4-hydroxy-tetrahydrodipicolinate synthase [Thermovibrio ammonificans]ADU96155.1 dihydrodipicolinate synthase [Thermovibrio ammonificans HB-1]
MFEGIYVAIPTPFKDGKVDTQALKDHVEFLIEQGVDGIVPCGTTGESATLSYEEHEEVIALTIEQAAGRVKVIAGTGSNSTEEAIRLTKFAQEVKADGALLITPYYNKPNQEGLYRHFKAVAEAVSIPIVLYNVPGRTGVNMLPETVARLSEIDNIVAIKEATGSTNVATEILNLTQGEIEVLSGDDLTFFPLLAVGAVGVISVTANVVPDRMVQMHREFVNGRWEKAQELHRHLYNLSKVMFIDTNPIPVKTALSMMGRMEKEFRLPLCPTTPEKEEVIAQTLKEYGVI